MRIVLMENLGCSPELVEENAARLRALGHEFTTFEKTTDTERLKAETRDADVLMLANMPLPAEVLAAAPDVKFIDVAFTGVDHIPVADARERGIAISNASGYADESVAELCISLMIQLLRHLGEAERRVREGGTKAGLGANLLQGKTVGIIGAGAIGKRLAALCKAFGCTVLAHNRRPVSDPAIDESVGLDELLRRSDIVSLHCPLTPETKGLIGAPQLAMMKKTALLINTARGPVVDNKALAEALNAGTIAGAACDVFDMEPPLPADYPLLHCKHIILTPHLAFYSQESLEERAKIAFANLFAWLAGKQANKI
ncbi:MULTISPECIES: NAD(P)-dependent oxidoreductase [unclassified Desulfovibrio]|uniref:NAD(P)-dependent oxidoreductase n=1 Tax=unclassified Desulfovibrio TaxID=2593640 RepID=UPI0013ECD639|nr:MULTISPECIES: NAD(P)-dependent oxidoreductase [unclassified Desulfovibrio]